MVHSRRLKYIPAFDGLRAFAVLAVISYHLRWTWIPGGFLGVDAFFVLSGFLITGLLCAEWAERSRIALGTFYLRRARRLLPALFLVLVAVAIFWAIAVPSDELGGLRNDGLAGLFYFANWHAIGAGQSYFALVAQPSGVQHLWSLAIEEQFYLVWPLVVIAAMWLGRGSKKLLGAVCVVGVASSVVLMAALYDPLDPSRSYYGTDTRVHALLIGALFALIPVGSALQRAVASRAGRGVGVLAGVGCLAAFTRVGDQSRYYYRGGSFVFAVLVGIVIVTSAARATAPMSRFLALPPLLWIGIRSYGIYLWHWPITVYVNEARTGLDGLSLDAVRVLLTFGIAGLSYVLVERPIREQRFVFRARWIALPLSFAAVGGVLLLGTAAATEPAPFLQARPGEVTAISSPPPPSTVPGAPNHTVQLFGDSVSATLSPELTKALADRGVPLATSSIQGCGVIDGLVLQQNSQPWPFAGSCNDVIPKFQNDEIARVKPALVLWLSIWEAQDRIINGQTVRLGTPAGDAVLRAAMDRTVARMTADGARVVLLTTAVPVPGDEPRVGASSDEPRRYQALNRLYRSYAKAHPDQVTLVDLARMECPNGPPCPERVDGVRLRPRDGLHFDDAGARWASKRIAPLIARCVTENKC